MVGDKRCPIVDTWWQTETGGHMIAPLPGAWLQKPGSASLPFFGVVPVIVNEKGEVHPHALTLILDYPNLPTCTGCVSISTLEMGSKVLDVLPSCHGAVCEAQSCNLIVSCCVLLQELEGVCEGYLCIKQAWPAAIRTIFGDQERFETTYFAPFKVRSMLDLFDLSHPGRQTELSTFL